MAQVAAVFWYCQAQGVALGVAFAAGLVFGGDARGFELALPGDEACTEGVAERSIYGAVYRGGYGGELGLAYDLYGGEASQVVFIGKTGYVGEIAHVSKTTEGERGLVGRD